MMFMIMRQRLVFIHLVFFLHYPLIILKQNENKEIISKYLSFSTYLHTF